MLKIVSQKITNELDNIFYKDINDQYELINNLYAKYKGTIKKANNKIDLDMIYKSYLYGLCIDMVKFPLLEYNDMYEILLPGTYGEDFNIHRTECLQILQDRINTIELDIDVNEFPLALIKVLINNDYPTAREKMVKETGIVCNSLLLMLKEYCIDMDYYYQYLFVARFVKTVIDMSNLDIIPKDSFIHDSITNLFFLMNALYSNMLLDSKDYLGYEVIEDIEYEN